MLLMHILSVYIFQVSANQQLYGWACWCRTWGCVLVPLSNFTKLSLTITINSSVKNCSAETWTNFDD